MTMKSRVLRMLIPFVLAFSVYTLIDSFYL